MDMAKRLQLRRFHRGEKIRLIAKLHDRKLPVWIAQRYRIIAYVYQELSVRAAAHHLGCAKETAYRCIKDSNRHGFRNFERSSNPEGRPSQITEPQRRTLTRVAQKRPTDVGLPFTNWSMTKLQDYLIKRRHFPVVSPEWLRQLLRRADVSWQRTKTWKQSHDPDFAAKKSVFWRSLPSVPSTARLFATINWDHWNCVPCRECVGHASANRSAREQPIRASAAQNNCMDSTMFMPIAWWDVCANARRLKISRHVLPSCEHATRSRFASTWLWTICQRISVPPMTFSQDTIWKRHTCPPMLLGSMRLNLNSRHSMRLRSRIQMIRTIPFVVAASTVTCDGATANTKAQSAISRDLCVRYLERH
jgi:transposase